MAPNQANIVHLPNGQTIDVKPVFGGLFFKANDLNVHNSILPAGWTIIINSEDYSDDPIHDDDGTHDHEDARPRRHHVHRYKQPTLRNDNMFISSISNPSSSDWKPPASPTRQIAMMLWTTLYWYFQQPEPPLYVTTEASKNTPLEARPRADWRINIKREGVFRGKHLLPKLERMGLIACEDSSVGCEAGDPAAGYTAMFVSRRSFWQVSPKLFLFTLTPTTGAGGSFPNTPMGSRPSSPVRNENRHGESPPRGAPIAAAADRSSRTITSSGLASPGLWAPLTPGPFTSGSHLPTYFPPPPPQYIITNGVRHPIRPKPFRQGETFYIRHIPSVDQYLSFRVASLSPHPVTYMGPVCGTSAMSGGGVTTHGPLAIPLHVKPSSATDKTPTPSGNHSSSNNKSSGPTSAPSSDGVPTPPLASSDNFYADVDSSQLSDLQLLHKWMNNPRVSKFWGCAGPQHVQEEFLRTNLSSRHSFPAIGCWDGKPFGYFEIYYVQEDILGRHLSPGQVEPWDRGVHVLIGEQEFRGAHRVKAWLSSLVHWALSGDYRTDSVFLEPRVDNQRYVYGDCDPRLPPSPPRTPHLGTSQDALFGGWTWAW
jgi:RimJ/RimL family protein N-acetyltransferase